MIYKPDKIERKNETKATFTQPFSINTTKVLALLKEAIQQIKL